MVDITLTDDNDDVWRTQFAEIGRQLRTTIGDRALAIHHIGSTAVPGLAAKPIVDVQITVVELERAVVDDVERAGVAWLPDNGDRRKWFFKRSDLFAVNCHVRRVGCPSQSQALLLRDYLRAEPSARERYVSTKRELAARTWPTVDDYADAKGDVVWQLLREADAWSWSGWRPPPTDA